MGFVYSHFCWSDFGGFKSQNAMISLFCSSRNYLQPPVWSKVVSVVIYTPKFVLPLSSVCLPEPAGSLRRQQQTQPSWPTRGRRAVFLCFCINILGVSLVSLVLIMSALSSLLLLISFRSSSLTRGDDLAGLLWETNQLAASEGGSSDGTIHLSWLFPIVLISAFNF